MADAFAHASAAVAVPSPTKQGTHWNLEAHRPCRRLLRPMARRPTPARPRGEKNE